MTRAELPQSLAEIRDPLSTGAHIAALKQLKHEIIGHEQRKELVVVHGVVGLLVRNLKDASRSSLSSSRAWSEEDEVGLQSVQIVTCLAHGGLASVQPLLAAGVVELLLARLVPGAVAPRLLVECLRAVNAITEALGTDVLASPDGSALGQLADRLFSRPTIDALAGILAQREDSLAVNEQVKLVLGIVCLALRDSRGAHQAALVKAGVLDFICCRLAAMVVKMGQNIQPLNPAFEATMLPSPPQPTLRYLLEALACLCNGSAYRSMRLLYSRHLLEVFPIVSPTTLAPGEYMDFSDSPTSSSRSPMDMFLPKLQAVQSKGEHNFSKAFPALGAFVGSSEMARMPYFSDPQALVSSRIISADEFGSPLIAWLIHMARNSTGLERLATLQLLTSLVSALDQKVMDSWSESSRNRDRTLAFLVVPLLVRIIEATDPKNVARAKLGAEELVVAKIVRERAPLVFAMLILECPALQRAAHDANAIKVLCQMLKKSFDPVTTARKAMWSALPSGVADMSTGMDDPTCSLGDAAMAAENIHRFRCRAASLRALGAIAQSDDSFRKNIIEMSVVTCLMDSLTPYPDGPVGVVQADVSLGKEGNPWFVITAACGLAQALSRSVGVLRTNLIDAGIAKPIFALLREHDSRIRAAGTDVVTNLVLQFSPMREELLSQGVVKVLCEHAHSADPELRLSALWAMKNLCAATPNDIKITVLEELGTGWLISTIGGEIFSTGSGRPRLATPNAAGEQVDLLNATDDTYPYMPEDYFSSSEEESSHPRSPLLRIPTVPARHRARLRAIQEEEESPILRARKDEVRIQLQALDLVRNLISEAGPSQPDMIEHLIQTMGVTRLFECLAAKLKPRPGVSTERIGVPAGKRPTLTTPGHSAAGNVAERERAAHLARMENFPVNAYIDDDLLVSTLFVFIHVANGRPQHRHTLLSLTTRSPTGQGDMKLLDLTIPLFSHPAAQIRTSCCWMVHNILWMEDQSDAAAARARAVELRKRGFEEAVNGCLGDPDLDVRERAKGCVNLWLKLSEGERGSERGGGRAWER